MFSITGEKDHSPFGSGSAELVFGLRPDGTYVHISEVPSGLACDCICPACGERIVANKGPIKVHYFSHYGQGNGCGQGAETNAHIWAKEILKQCLEIMLPAVEAREGREHFEVHPAQLFKFDDADLEQRTGNVVPDVILTRGKRQLIVEIFVTHRCDDIKIARLREQGISAIEIDLSRFGKGSTEEQVASALIGKDGSRPARRKWLYNPKEDAAKITLREQIEAREAEQRAQIEAQEKARKERAEAAMIVRQRRAAEIVEAAGAIKQGSNETLDADLFEVEALREDDLIGIACPGAQGFTVSTRHWQAAILSRLVLRKVGTIAGASYRDGRPFESRRALDAIHDCIAPEFIAFPSIDLMGDVRRMSAGFLFPHEAVSHYLAWLCKRGVLEQKPRESGLFIAEDWGQRVINRTWQLERVREGRGQLNAILDAIPDEEKVGFSVAQWLERPIPDVADSFEGLAEGWNSNWTKLERGLAAIARMQSGGPVVEESLGLPVQGEIERAIDRDRAAKEEAARNRGEALAREARQYLGSHADAWLNSAPASGDRSYRGQAESSQEAYEHSRAALFEYRAELQIQAEREQTAKLARNDLQKAAKAAYDPDHAKVFLNSTRPELGMSPLAYCVDQDRLKRCLRLLPKSRR